MPACKKQVLQNPQGSCGGVAAGSERKIMFFRERSCKNSAQNSARNFCNQTRVPLSQTGIRRVAAASIPREPVDEAEGVPGRPFSLPALMRGNRAAGRTARMRKNSVSYIWLHVGDAFWKNSAGAVRGCNGMFHLRVAYVHKRGIRPASFFFRKEFFATHAKELTLSQRLCSVCPC